MQISVVSSVGAGRTLLSAFDNALYNAGVCNYNLIVLSSIIPPKSKIIKLKKYQTPEREFGHKLYLIKSELRSDKKGEVIASGLGWYQFGDGRGFFVEYEERGENEKIVRAKIKEKISQSLEDMCRFRKSKIQSASWRTNVKSSIAVACVGNQPTCVLTLAVYQSEEWRYI